MERYDENCRTVTDTAGNVYVRAVGPTALLGSLTQSIYYAKSIRAASANMVTVRFSGTATFPDIRIAEYSGLDPLDPWTRHRIIGFSTTSSSGSLTTTNANDLLSSVRTLFCRDERRWPRLHVTSHHVPDSDILEDRVVNSGR